MKHWNVMLSSFSTPLKSMVLPSPSVSLTSTCEIFALEPTLDMFGLVGEKYDTVLSPPVIGTIAIRLVVPPYRLSKLFIPRLEHRM